MDVGFAAICQLARTRPASHQVLVHRLASLLRASFRPHLAVSVISPLRSLSPSMVGSKAANGGQVKTGQRMWPGTQMFYPVVCILGKPNHNCWFCSLTFLWCRGGSTRSPHERAEAEARKAVKDAERGTSGAPRSGL